MAPTPLLLAPLARLLAQKAKNSTVRRSGDAKGLPQLRVCQSNRTGGNVALRTTARRWRPLPFGKQSLGVAWVPGVLWNSVLISNSALNPSVYWTTLLLPPLFSGLAGPTPGCPNDRASLACLWEQRSEWGKIRSQVKGCDALFWIQLAARPNGPIHLASYLNLGARRSNFVLDAWKPSLTKIGLVATVERLPIRVLSLIARRRTS